MKGTIIGRYIDVTSDARHEEQKKDYPYAAKLWRRAAQIADKQHRTPQANFCNNRADFCEGMARRASL